MPEPHRDDRGRVLLDTAFGVAQIGDLRHRVETLSRANGVDGDSLDDWVMAVNELAGNAVRHGSPTARLTLLVADALECWISDDGPGFDPSRYLGRRERPVLSPTGGMGLWMVEQATTVVSLTSDATGTTIAIAAR